MNLNRSSGSSLRPVWIFKISSITSPPAVRDGSGVSAVMSAEKTGLGRAISTRSVTIVKSSVVIGSARAACLCNGLRCAWRAKDVQMSREKMQYNLLTPERGWNIVADLNVRLQVAILLPTYIRRCLVTYIVSHVGGCSKNGGRKRAGKCMKRGAKSTFLTTATSFSSTMMEHRVFELHPQ